MEWEKTHNKHFGKQWKRNVADVWYVKLPWEAIFSFVHPI